MPAWKVKLFRPASTVTARPTWVAGSLRGWTLAYRGSAAQRHFEGEVHVGATRHQVDRRTAWVRSWWNGPTEEEKEGRLQAELGDGAACWVLLAGATIVDLRLGSAPPKPTGAAALEPLPTAFEAMGAGPGGDDGFHNPYAFVGLVPRNDGDAVWGRQAPPPLDRLHPGRLTGSLTVELTTLTPYFSAAAVSDAEEADEERERKPRVRAPRGDIPSTSLKGAIRSFYETLTNSCLAVVDPGRKRLSYRTSAGSPDKLEPLRVHVDAGGEVHAEHMQMVRVLAYDASAGHLSQRAADPAAAHYPHAPWDLSKLTDRQRVFFREQELAVVLVCKRENVGRLHGHRDEVEAFHVRDDRPRDDDRLPARRSYLEGRIETLGRAEAQRQGGPEVPPGTKVVRLSRPWSVEGVHYGFLVLRRDRDGRLSPHRAEGQADGTRVWCTARKAYRVCVGLRAAGDGPCPDGWKEGFLRRVGPVIRGKRFEAVFYPYAPPRGLDLPKAVEREYEHLIAQMQRLHAGQPRNETAQRDWSPFITEPERARLRDGDLIFGTLASGAVERLYPVQMSRALYRRSIFDVLAASPASTHVPCTDPVLLCPACRLFGWVPAGGPGRRGAGGALRGRLQISAATAKGPVVEQFRSARPLAVLSAPKANRAAFYLGNGGWDDQGAELAGRKHYWHHRSFQVGSVNRDTHDTQNVAITGWVPAGKTFRATVRFEDLSREELGGLVACLALPEKMALRIGAGKPLGLGSFASRVTAITVLDPAARYGRLEAGARAATNEDVEAWLQAFGGSLLEAYPPAGSPREAPLSEVPFVAEVVRIASGPPTALPVQYPPTGFEWFKRNESRRLAKPLEEQGLPLE